MSGKKTPPTRVNAVERLPHRYPTRWKLRHDTKLRRNSPYLPTEVIFQILIFVPAKSLFDAARYVCKQWYDIINDPDFIKAHYQISTPGFLFRDSCYRDSHMTYIDANSPNSTEIQIPARVTEMSCFNGLVLFSTRSDREILFHVANPVTKENISLPRLAAHEGRMYESTASLSVDSRGHYKVVFALDVSTFYEEDRRRRMGVFTIGIDKAWRFLDLEGIPVGFLISDTISFSPQPFGGFIYWYEYNYNTSASRSDGFALDIDTETIYQFSQPKDVVFNLASATFIIIGTSLGFMLAESRFLWRLWKLTDVKSGEWTQLPCINVGTLHSHFDKVFGLYVNLIYNPVKLDRGDLWLYRRINDENLVVRYNFVNEKMVVFPMKIGISHRSLRPHINTLVSPKNFNYMSKSGDRFT
ncbi:putative F-box protein At4g09190 [Silene latifolia]|uniref:putative F-box protein At4g09190 n=1 Tax=Silene latifolia TaxID=37657 RepID=UPI003D78A29D